MNITTQQSERVESSDPMRKSVPFRSRSTADVFWRVSEKIGQARKSAQAAGRVSEHPRFLTVTGRLGSLTASESISWGKRSFFPTPARRPFGSKSSVPFVNIRNRRWSASEERPIPGEKDYDLS